MYFLGVDKYYGSIQQISNDTKFLICQKHKLCFSDVDKCISWVLTNVMAGWINIFKHDKLQIANCILHYYSWAEHGLSVTPTYRLGH